jgi:hypothetical protein
VQGGALPRDLRRWANYLIFLLPPLALAGWIYLQPEDRLFLPRQSGTSARGLLYHVDDMTAVATRSLNAELGRKAGRLDGPRPLTAEEFNAQLDADPPLADRYFLEYPHITLLVFRLPWMLQGELPAVPPAVADGDYETIVRHQPRNEDERRLWQSYVWTTRFYVCLMTACLLALMLLVRWGYEPSTGLRGGAVLLVLPAALYFSINRYDILPAFMTAAALACVGRRWFVASAVALALAALLKVYPVLLAPLVLRYVGTDWRRALSWCAAFGITLVAGAGWPLLVGEDLESILGPFRFQFGRDGEPFQMALYGWVLPAGLESGLDGKVFRLGTIAAALVLFCWRRPPTLASVLRRGAVVVILFASVNVFYSPQWIIWFSPLLVPLVGRQRSLAWGVVALDLITYLSYPVWAFLYMSPNRIADFVPGVQPETAIHAAMVVLVYARFVALAVLVFLLLRAEWREVRAARAADTGLAPAGVTAS